MQLSIKLETKIIRYDQRLMVLLQQAGIFLLGGSFAVTRRICHQFLAREGRRRRRTENPTSSSARSTDFARDVDRDEP